MPQISNFIGVGIYSVQEAARLTDISPGRIRRWIKGYTYKSKGTERESQPVWRSQLPLIDGAAALSFADLIEVRFVSAFLEKGVTWPTLRKASKRATELFKTEHPFSTRQFKTDGRDIFAELTDGSGEKALIDLARSQYALERILRPYLRGLEFSESDQVIRWWPLGHKRKIVIDPLRSFGQPIISDEGIPTNILAKSLQVEGSIETVARWYGVSAHSVREAAKYEKKLAA